MSITREQIKDLAEFHDNDCAALTFYFQPQTPRNKAHKEDTILIKDLAREALRKLEEGSRQDKSQGENKTHENKAKRDSVRADLDRILRLSAELRSNRTQAKAIFACAAQNVWQQHDLPPQLMSTQLFVDRHFHLKPVAHLLGASPSLGIVLVDRHRARLFDLRLGELTEHEGLFQSLSRKGRSDGYAGYDGGHAQRRVDDEALHHFKAVAETVKESLEKGIFEKWILGCQDGHVSQLEVQLHPYASQSLLGRFSGDIGHVTDEEIRSHAQRIVERWQEDRRHELLGHVLNEARSHGRGVTGLRRVLRSLELGEVQTILIGEDFEGHAVECAGCGHMDAHLIAFCPVCGRATREVVDVGEAILPWIIRRNIEMFFVHEDPEFDKVGSIAALLHFRSENARPENVPPIDAAIANRLKKAGSVYPGRLRRFATR